MRTPMSLVMMTALAVLSGCASPTSEASSGTVSRPVTTTPTPVKAPSPKQLHRKVRAALTTAGSGVLVRRTSTGLDDGSLTVVVDSSYDLKAKNWQSRMHYESDSPTMLKSMPDMTEMTINARGIGSDGVYLQMPGWPRKLRNRWLPMSSANSVGQSSTLAMVDPDQASCVAPFLDLRPTAVEPEGSGWILTGRVPAPIAAQVLGLANSLLKAKVPLDDLKGSAKARIHVAADGTPSRLEMKGTSLKVRSPLPPQTRGILPLQEATIKLSRLGQPVDIEIPTGRELIDSSEMNP